VAPATSVSQYSGVRRPSRSFARSTAAAKRGALDYAVYERVSGGDQPGYIVVVQFNAWAAVASAETDPARTIVRSLASNLSRVQTETWLYRPDLVYFPKR
jgi:hypothetical protein